MKRGTKLTVVAVVSLILFLVVVPVIPFQVTLPPNHSALWCTERELPCALVGIQSTYHGYGSLTYVLFGLGIHVWLD